MPLLQLQTKGGAEKEPEEICVFAQTNFRNKPRRFGIKLDDRRRHMYIIGKTGMGKSTMMENMMLHDIYSGHGVGLVDPHGDFAEKIINYIPSWRINDIAYLNPSDMGYPIGFNILEVHNEEQKHLVAAGMMATFKKIWPDVWSARMEYILNNTLLALLEYPGSTLLGINRLLADKKYRGRVVRKITDPVIKAFWQNEFANYPDRYMTEAVAPIQNKIGQFLSASIIRNMVAQVKSTIDVRQLMDEGKILIMNLAKGRIGEDNSRLLGGMLITKIQLSAMERVDQPEAQRRDFFLYVDEFQNFATPSFANILSEARKYRLSLVMAHQYITQLDEIVADAVFGNVGSLVTFRVGAADAEILAKEFAPIFLEEDIVNLAKYQVMLKLMIDGVASQPFSALTLSPIGHPTDSAEKVIRVSRERYATRREHIEEKIMRWSGMDAGGEEDDEDDDDLDQDDAPKPKPKDVSEKKPLLEKKPSLEKKSPSEAKAVEIVSTEKPLSLSQLVPRETAAKHEKPLPSVVPKPQEEKPQELPKPVSAAPQAQVKEQTQMRDEPKQAFNRQPPTTGASNIPGTSATGEGGEKRKRKRNRKKKRDGGTPSQDGQIRPLQPPQALPRPPQPQPVSPVAPQSQHAPQPQPPQPPTAPPEPKQVLSPNQVIRFD